MVYKFLLDELVFLHSWVDLQKIRTLRNPAIWCNLKIFVVAGYTNLTLLYFFTPTSLSLPCTKKGMLIPIIFERTKLKRYRIVNLQGQESTRTPGAASESPSESDPRISPERSRESKLIKIEPIAPKWIHHQHSPTKFNCQDTENLDDLKFRAATISMADSDFEITAQTRHGAVSNHTGSCYRELCVLNSSNI